MPVTNTQDSYDITSIGVRHINPSIMEGEHVIGSILGDRAAIPIVRYGPTYLVDAFIYGGITIPSTLTCNPGVVDASPQAEFSYQWQADGVDIVGATDNEYTTDENDDGVVFRCVVDATNFLGTVQSTTSTITAELIEPIRVEEQAFYSITGLNQKGYQDVMVSRAALITGMAAPNRLDVLTDVQMTISGLWVEDRFDVMAQYHYAVSGLEVDDYQQAYVNECYAITFYTYDQDLVILNPGAENDMTDWTVTSGVFRIRTTDPAPHSGTKYFAGGTGTTTCAAYQDVALPGGVLTDVDANEKAISIEFYQSSDADRDRVHIYLEFFDAGMGSLGTEDGSFETATKRNIWTEVQTSPSLIPPLTRTIRVHMKMVWVSGGGSNDGYADDILLKLWTNT